MLKQKRLEQFFATKRDGESSFGLILVLIAMGIAGRLLPHWPNFTPIGALAVWGGLRLNRQWNIIILLVTMMVTDLFLGWHATWLYVYGSLLVTTWLASKVKSINAGPVVGMTLLGAIVFFVVTNFGVWQTSSLYPHTLGGLMASYVAGLPFFRASLSGDIAYTVLFFTLDALALTLAQKQGIVAQVKSK